MDTTVKTFFGRDKEIEILKRLARDSRTGDAESFFISGKRGVGKTALMRHLYQHLFYEQEEVIPFFYTLSPVITSITRFSEDYLIKFIQQTFAFLRRDPEILGSGILLLDDMEVISRRLDEQWAIEIIKDFLHVKDSQDPEKTFLSVVTAPLRVYEHVKRPVIILIDDFHEICSVSSVDKKIWLLFEEPLKYPYTPHLFTGSRSLLSKMLFNETSFGKDLRLINIEGLDRENSKKLFISLCDAYGINVDAECDVILDRLQGNPSYIRALVYTARNTEDTITIDGLRETYHNEIRDGAIFTYWASYLQRYIPLHLRETSLRLLYHLCSINTWASLSDMADLPFIRGQELNDVIESLQSAGILQEGLGTFKLVDDLVLRDVIKEIYQREILKEDVFVKREDYDEEEGNVESGSKKVEVKIASDDIVAPSTQKGIIKKEKVYVLLLIIIVIIAVIVYMNIRRPHEEQSRPSLNKTLSFPSFHDDVIRKSLKKDQKNRFPSFRDEAITLCK